MYLLIPLIAYAFQNLEIIEKKCFKNASLCIFFVVIFILRKYGLIYIFAGNCQRNLLKTAV